MANKKYRHKDRQGEPSLFYYVDCPECKKDLSQFVKPEDVDENPTFCLYCETKLRLKYTEQYDEEMGDDFGMYWYEKWDKE
jgi:ribosomal protein S27E